MVYRIFTADPHTGEIKINAVRDLNLKNHAHAAILHTYLDGYLRQIQRGDNLLFSVEPLEDKQLELPF